MFDQLFKQPNSVARHRSGPMLDERIAFLTRLADRGVSRSTLRQTAQRLLVLIETFRLVECPDARITRDQIRQKATDKYRFLSLASRWLQFLGRLEERPKPESLCADELKAFADYMEHERGLSPTTIRSYCYLLPRFLNRLVTAAGSLREVSASHIDETLKGIAKQRVYSRVTIQGWASTLRAFFRYAEARNWCRSGLAASIRGPRVFAQTPLPAGPSWDSVRRLLAMTEGDRSIDIRDRAILMLLAIYGLRAGEVRRLRLDDFDWEHELLTVVSSKTRRQRTYPLTHAVGDAVLRYLKVVRPASSHREIFLTFRPPVRPMSHVWFIVARRLRSLNVSISQFGPHALRHACASRLLAQGLSLKEIGDHLGHVDPETTRIYAKVDLAGLREVADFDLGGLL